MRKALQGGPPSYQETMSSGPRSAARFTLIALLLVGCGAGSEPPGAEATGGGGGTGPGGAGAGNPGTAGASAGAGGGAGGSGGASPTAGATSAGTGGTLSAAGAEAGGGMAGQAGSAGTSSMGGAAGMGGTSGGGGAGGGGSAVSVPLDPSLMSRCTGTKPITCTIPVPADGNYNVTVELGSASAASTSRVQAELYRIVVAPVTLAAGAYSQHTFSVNVRNEVHDGYKAPGKQLDVLIDGDAPALHGLGFAAAAMPTLFVVGDSTVCDWDPAHASAPSERGWAQELSQYLKPGLAVANYADSGDTAGSLYGKFAARGAVMKAGDFLFIQFGHNDQKTQADKDSYQANLMKFIKDARDKSATPILFSPVARKSATLADPGFAGLDQQARDLAKSANVAFVDLTTLAINYYATVPDKSALFMTASEGTHFSEAGATAISGLVAKALKSGTTPTTTIGAFFK